jgi:hypothetical protein
MMPTTPSGCITMRARPGRNQIEGDLACGFIQPAKCERVWRIASRLGNSSSRRVSCAERWPKSAAMASTKALAVVVHQREQGVEPRLPRARATAGIAPGGGMHGVELATEGAAGAGVLCCVA